MNPWTIIGWGVLAIAGLFALVVALFIWDTYAKKWLAARALHYKTRRTPPAVGQVWLQGDTWLTVTGITEAGRVCLTTQMVVHGRRLGNGASWSDSPEEWQRRVMERRLCLVTDGAS